MSNGGRPPALDDNDAAIRRARALELRIAGLTYKQVAADIGITQRACVALVREAAANLRDEKAFEYRAISNGRYDLAVSRSMAIMLDAEKPAETRLSAARTIGYLTEKQARMNGAMEPDVVLVLSREEQEAADEERATRLLAVAESYLQGIVDATATVEGEQ